MSLLAELEGLRPRFAAIAQETYAGWPVPEGDGICAMLADQFSELIFRELSVDDACVVDLEDPGPPHTICIAERGAESYVVDLDWQLYETVEQLTQDCFLFYQKPDVTITAADFRFTTELRLAA